MDDDRLDDLLRDAAKDYHPPAPTPREEIWAHIERRRAAARRGRRRRRFPFQTPAYMGAANPTS